MPTEPVINIDVLIFGGGIAGLWTLARLRREGYSCVLLERKALGSGQTIASQGIIHGGIKYALTGKASAASKAIAEMPGIWRACLRGEGEVDLRGVKVLSERQYLWTTTGIGSRLMGLAASKVIRTSVEPLPVEARPEWMKDAPRGVNAYAVDEPVIDPQSLLESLAAPLREWIGLPDFCERGGFYPDQERGENVGARAQPGIHVRSRATVLCTGRGNTDFNWLRRVDTGDATPVSQLRPLQMVMVRAQSYRKPLPFVYGHCVGASDKPRITVTTGIDAGHHPVWYVGGDIAERGAGMTRPALIDEARQEVARCMPWLDLTSTQWATLQVDRAEGTTSGERPNEPVVLRSRRTIAVWPTKLAFAPLAASLVVDRLRELGIEPAGDSEATRQGLNLINPRVATLPWNETGVTWT